jgi:thioredoxin 1
MKKSSIIAILAIFIIPLAIYYFMHNASQMSSTAEASANMPKVLQFSSAMCHDCKKLETEIAPLRQEYRNKVVFQKIDVASSSPSTQQLIQSYNVTVVPTLVFMDRNGNTRERTEGSIPQSQLRSYLNEIQ